MGIRLPCRTSPRIRQFIGPPSNALRSFQTAVPFSWEDPLNVASLLYKDELAIQETARSYCKERLVPRVLGEPLGA